MATEIKPGMTFGRLTVMEIVIVAQQPHKNLWRVKCTCGKLFDIRQTELSKIDNTKMCRECAKAKCEFIYSRISERVIRKRKVKEAKKRYYESGQYLKKPKPVFED